MNRPTTSILNPAFRWTPSYATDIGKRFARMKLEREKEKAQTDADTQRVVSIFDAINAKREGT